MSFHKGFRKFTLLLWKNYKLQIRHKKRTIIEFVVPHLFTAVLIILRALVDSEEIKEPTFYPEFDVLDPNMTSAFGSKFILYAPDNAATRNIMKVVEEDLHTYPYLPNYTYKAYGSETDLEKDYNSSEDFTQRFTPKFSQKNSNPVYAAVIFVEVAKTIKYRIRFPSTPDKSFSPVPGLKPIWRTQSLYAFFQIPEPREALGSPGESQKYYQEPYYLESKLRGGTPGYWREGFLFFQAILERAIIKSTTNEPSVLDKFQVFLNRFPFPPYRMDRFIIVLQQNLGLFLVLSLTFPTMNIARSVALEKERRLKESMKMMGLPNWLHWTAWFVKDYSFHLVAVIIMTCMYKIPWFGNGLCILTFADGSVLCFFLAVYVFSTVTMGYLFASMFSTAPSAATGSFILFFITYFPYFIVHPRYFLLTKAEKFGISIFSNSAVCIGAQIITVFEGTQAGIQWDTLGRGASPEENMSLLDVIIMLLFNGVMHLLFAIYIEAVFPGDYGIPLPWYFPFTKWYWCNTPRGSTVGIPEPISGALLAKPPNEYFESEPDGTPGIQIKELTKIFKNKVAVNNLTLNFYQNEVTALLGHNGAGKTTTMSMLTGLFPPTSGTAIVNGFDIRTDITSVRESLGLCPQHDVLFDELTVEEHLFFFCSLKGHSGKYVTEEVDRMLQAINLEYKRGAQAHTLSGGMKRRLSVGIALIGNSKIVLLDEPTSGMDPGARRGTWDLISQEKKGRTIVLSTHFMDEADLLGDRIAIMAEGQVRCCGSSLFLKKKYGGGYHLIIVKLGNCDVDKITGLLQRYIPEVEVEQDIGAELSYSLPDEKSGIFPEIFKEIESKKHALGIESYGCSITQMEEVFMRVGRHAEEELKLKLKSEGKLPGGKHANGETDNDTTSEISPAHHPKEKVKHHHHSKSADPPPRHPEVKVKDNEVKDPSLAAFREKMSKLKILAEAVHPDEPEAEEDRSSTNISLAQGGPPQKKNNGLRLILQQIYAMLVKKCLYTKKNIIILLAFMSPPVIFLILASIMLASLPDLTLSPERKMELSQYNVIGKPVTTIACSSSGGICGTYENIVRDASTVKYVGSFDRFIIEKSKESLSTVTFHYIVGLDVTEKNDGTKLKGYFNNQPYHSPPLALNLISTALLRNITRKNDYTLEMSNYPLPQTPFEAAQNLDNAQQVGFIIGFNIAIGAGYVASSFVVFLIKERVSKSKHLQFLSGCKFVIFWLVHLLFDFVIYIIACLVIIIVIVAFGTRDFSDKELLPDVFFVLMLYGWAQLPMMYLGSFIFSVPSTAYIMIGFLNFFTGLACMLVNAVLRLDELELTHVAETLDLFFMFFPTYNIGNSLQLLSMNKQLHEICPQVQRVIRIPLSIYCNNPIFLTDEQRTEFPCCRYCKGFHSNFCFRTYLILMIDLTLNSTTRRYMLLDPIRRFAWKWPGIGKYMFVSVLTGAIGLTALFIVESKIVLAWMQDFQTKKLEKTETLKGDPNAIEDSDVAAENKRIRETKLEELFNTDTMILKDLTKLYGNFKAVDRLCVGVKSGECFGLLGVNGAGKTTTFKMLSGDIRITFGDGYIMGKSVRSKIKKVQRLLGYCPQFDALIPEMTGRETIRMFARLRGIPEKEIDGVIDKLGEVLLFSEHMEKPCGTYSGGNKRKLSTAIALTGDPPIVFLDEPTSGMDPVARRHLWNAINHVVRHKGTSVVLTSHSMEECEALCTRLAIMVNGKFRCLGSTQHLKNKFGDGYTLTAQITQEHHKDIVISRSSVEIGRRASSGDAKPLQKWELELVPFRNFIEEAFRGSCELKDIHPGYVYYHINGDNISWAQMFKTMEEAKKEFPIEAYSVGQTSLEQIFLSFTKAQITDD